MGRDSSSRRERADRFGRLLASWTSTARRCACLRQREWKPYQRAARADTLLVSHAESSAVPGGGGRLLGTGSVPGAPAPQYRGSYETVKRFVRPLREKQLQAAVTRTRFETPPGTAEPDRLGAGAGRGRWTVGVRHIFVLTLGYSRRSFYVPCLSEALGDLLDAHEQAFAHFGGHTQEHLYDRPRTVCAPRGATGCGGTRRSRVRGLLGLRAAAVPALPGADEGEGRVGRQIFQAKFPGRTSFRDDLDFYASRSRSGRRRGDVAGARDDARAADRPLRPGTRRLGADAGGSGVSAEAPLTRVVATDYLVTVDTNRYSVPFTLIGQPVEVLRRDGLLQMRHRGQVVATHAALAGRHQLRILPEHGPGPIARNARLRYSTGGHSTGAVPLDVETPGPRLLRNRVRTRGWQMMSPQMTRLDELLQQLRLNTVRERLEALHVTMRTNLARFPFIKGCSTASTSATSRRSTGSRSRS